ncbi:DUF222 domain-containing protein [Agromyces soli]
MEDLFEYLGVGVALSAARLDEIERELEVRADAAGGLFPPDPRFDPDGGEAADAFATLASRSPYAALEHELARAHAALADANRAMASHYEALRRAFDTAQRHPELYLPERYQRTDAPTLAARALATELSMRLGLPAGTLRSRAAEAKTLYDRLPLVRQRFLDGIAGAADAGAAATAALAFEAGDPRLGELDESLSSVIGTVGSTRFRRRIRAVLARLDRAGLEARHARAHADRRVVVEHADDGMSWVSLFVSSIDATRIEARLDAFARAPHGRDEQRTLPQLRADAAVDWLTGTGTATAVHTEVIVTIPALGLIGQSDALAQLEGVGPIDDATARRLFDEAPSFRRLVTDPVHGAPLKLDRTRYRPTRAQRVWLALTYGRCTRPGCDRPAKSCDLDHLTDWALGGRTDDDNLAPACRSDHVVRHRTAFTIERRADGAVEWRSPSGYSASDPPPGAADGPPLRITTNDRSPRSRAPGGGGPAAESAPPPSSAYFAARARAERMKATGESSPPPSSSYPDTPTF